MHHATRIKNNTAAAAVVAAMGAVGLGLAAPAHAQQHEGGVSARVGLASNMQRYELAWESPSMWSRQFDGSRLDLVGEAGVAYWRAQGNRHPSSAWQLSLIPMLRWSFDGGYYLEAGVGPTLFNHASIADKQISTAFQFGNHIGGGMYLSRSSRLGVRLSHFSNAGIKRPNPGLNVVQVTYTYQF